MSKDFRQFLGQLERDSPHEVIRVKQPVNPAAVRSRPPSMNLFASMDVSSDPSERRAAQPPESTATPLTLKLAAELLTCW